MRNNGLSLQVDEPHRISSVCDCRVSAATGVQITVDSDGGLTVPTTLRCRLVKRDVLGLLITGCNETAHAHITVLQSNIARLA